LFSDAQQWTGQRASLEDQAIKSSDRSPELLVKNLDAIPYYQEQHRKVFGTDFNPEGVAKAIAAYERTILSGNSPYRFDAGDKKALSAAAQRCLALFKGKANCVTCHVSFNFTDENYHNLGVGMDKANPDLGRYTVSKTDEHEGAFKTPTLRDVARRPPYIHDGTLPTLEEVVAFTIKAVSRISGFRKKYARPLSLSAQEEKD
jgi:cytochrome c peroxidase